MCYNVHLLTVYNFKYIKKQPYNKFMLKWDQFHSLI